MHLGKAEAVYRKSDVVHALYQKLYTYDYNL